MPPLFSAAHNDQRPDLPVGLALGSATFSGFLSDEFDVIVISFYALSFAALLAIFYHLHTTSIAFKPTEAFRALRRRAREFERYSGRRRRLQVVPIAAAETSDATSDDATITTTASGTTNPFSHHHDHHSRLRNRHVGGGDSGSNSSSSSSSNNSARRQSDLPVVVEEADSDHPPAPGEQRTFDFTSPTPPVLPAPSSLSTLRIVQWSIDRGTELPGIMRTLQALEADVIMLQDVDWGCARTVRVNMVRAIARRLRMQAVFVGEFHESRFERSYDDANDNGDDGRRHGRRHKRRPLGVQGHAILTRHHIVDAWVIPHQHVAHEWAGGADDREGGGRFALAALIDTPHVGHLSSVVCYCLHLETNCGPFGRYKQFLDIIQDTAARKHRLLPQMVAGNLGTVSQGWARFIPRYNDGVAYGMHLCHSEARLWNNTILPELAYTSAFPVMGTCNAFWGGLMHAQTDWVLFRQLQGLAEVTHTAYGGGEWSSHCYMLVDISRTDADNIESAAVLDDADDGGGGGSGDDDSASSTSGSDSGNSNNNSDIDRVRPQQGVYDDDDDDDDDSKHE